MCCFRGNTFSTETILYFGKLYFDAVFGIRYRDFLRNDRSFRISRFGFFGTMHHVHHIQHMQPAFIASLVAIFTLLVTRRYFIRREYFHFLVVISSPLFPVVVRPVRAAHPSLLRAPRERSANVGTTSHFKTALSSDEPRREQIRRYDLSAMIELFRDISARQRPRHRGRGIALRNVRSFTSVSRSDGAEYSVTFGMASGCAVALSSAYNLRNASLAPRTRSCVRIDQRPRNRRPAGFPETFRVHFARSAHVRIRPLFPGPIKSPLRIVGEITV